MPTNKLKLTSSIYFITLIITSIISRIVFFNPQKINIENLNINNSLVFKEILIKNTFCFILILSAILLGKYILYIFLSLNGCLLGLFISKFSSITYFLAIIPHGITELFSLLLTSSIVLDILTIEKITSFHKKAIVFSFFLLIFSAFIESFVTPIISSKFIL